jgi:hypothetical protein
MIRTVGNGERKPPPPYRLQIFKGMKNIIIHRDFVDFVLDDPIAIEFKEWLEDTCCPEVRPSMTSRKFSDLLNSYLFLVTRFHFYF